MFRIGIDIGGTKVKVGAIDGHGAILSSCSKLFIQNYSDPFLLLDAIEEQINQLTDKLSDNQLGGIGIGCPGPLDRDRVSVLETPNLKLLSHFPLVSEFRKRFSVPIRMNNDANVFVFGEAVHGAGRNHSIVYGMTIGTGFGHGLIIDEKIFDGATGTATEFALTPYRDSVIEDYVSGRALEKFYQLRTGQVQSGEIIFQLAEQQDEMALAAWRELGIHLGNAMIPIIFLIDPHVIVLGGSVSAGFHHFRESMQQVLDSHLWDVQKQTLKICKSELGSNAPLIGAANLVPVQPD